MQKGAPPPAAPARDHTSLVVQAGLLLLFLVGLLTVFGEPLYGALFPPAEPPAHEHGLPAASPAPAAPAAPSPPAAVPGR